MPKVLVSGEVVYWRTVELLRDLSVDVSRVRYPRVVRFPEKPKLDYKATHAQRAQLDDMVSVFKPCLMWSVERPEFVIDEAELPY